MLNLLRSTAICLAALTAAPAAHAFDLTPPARSFEDEREVASGQHEQILAEFGGAYDDADLAAYVTRVGELMAQHSDMPDKPFNFTVLNTPMVNAFTVGGGYVYVTRGILASINSEAELAALIGHEIGHVTARHTARRETRMQHDRAVSIGIGILTGSLSAAIMTDALSNVGQQAYSRGQEAQSDKLGVKSLVKAGYDPFAMADMLDALNREVALMEKMSGGGGMSVPAWLQDHPQTDDRIRDTTRQARRTGVERGTGTINRAAHLDAVDGVVFGNDPRFGTLRDGRYIHPALGIAFDVPKGYSISDQSGFLVGVRDKSSFFLFTGAAWPADRSLEDFALTAWDALSEGSGGKLDELKETSINGLDAIIARKKVDSFAGDANLATVAYRGTGDVVFGLSFVVAGEITGAVEAEFTAIAESFATLSAEEIAAIKPHRVKVVTAGSGDTVESLSEKMAFDNFKVDRFRALNGDDVKVTAGERYKVIVEE